MNGKNALESFSLLVVSALMCRSSVSLVRLRAGYRPLYGQGFSGSRPAISWGWSDDLRLEQAEEGATEQRLNPEGYMRMRKEEEDVKRSEQGGAAILVKGRRRKPKGSLTIACSRAR